MTTLDENVGRHFVGVPSVVDRHRELMAKYRGFVAKASALTSCVHCGTRYRPYYNLIKRECWMHPGSLRTTLDGYRMWSCCSAPEAFNGCVSCMHTDKKEMRESMCADPFNSFAEVPVEVLDLNMVPFNPDIVVDFPEGSPSLIDRPGKFYRIRRVVV